MTLFHNKILIINNCFVVAVISLPRGVQLFVTPWTVTHQVSLSMGFPRQEHWSGLPFPSPGDLPNTGIEPRSPALKTDSLPSEPPGKPIYKEDRRVMNSGYKFSRFSFWSGDLNT